MADSRRPGKENRDEAKRRGFWPAAATDPAQHTAGHMTPIEGLLQALLHDVGREQEALATLARRASHMRSSDVAEQLQAARSGWGCCSMSHPACWRHVSRNDLVAWLDGKMGIKA